MEQTQPGSEQAPTKERQIQQLKAQVYDLSIERGRYVTAANEIQKRIHLLAEEIAKLEEALAGGGEKHE